MQRLIFALIGQLTDPLLADSIAGDLEEESRRRAHGSPLAARAWLWRALLGISFHALVSRLRDRVLALRHFRFRPQWHDCRHSVRVLRNNPWYSAAAILVMALTISLSTTAFGILEHVLFRPLPYDRPGDLVHVGSTWSQEARARSGGRLRTAVGGAPLSLRDVADLAEAVPDTKFAAYGGATGERVIGGLGPWRPVTAPVTASFLEVLGVRPIAGGFDASDFEASATRLTPALITTTVWQNRFGGRLDIAGVEYATEHGEGGVRYRIAGVLPADFVYPLDGVVPDVLVPLIVPAAELRDRQARRYEVIARLSSGTPAEAQARFSAVMRDAQRDFSDKAMNDGAGAADAADVMPFADWFGRTPRSMATQVVALTLLLVLLGCINVSSLVASRALDRRRELALRRAIGAGAGEIAALVVAECALIVGAGAALGVLMSMPLMALTVRVMPAGTLPGSPPALDWRVLLFAAVVSAACAFIVILWPLVRAVRHDPSLALSDGGPLLTPSGSKGRRAAHALQVALGLTITVCAAFVVGSLLRAMGTDIGYATEHLVVIEAQYPPAFKLTHSDAERLKRLELLRSIVAPALDDMLVRVRALPGVIAVGASHGTILRRRGIGSGFGDNFAITDGFVEALQPRLVRGRWPTRDEISAGTPVAVISEDIARRFVSGPPLGQTIRNYADGSSMLEVIGVSEEARYRSWDAKGQQGQVFSPYRTTAFDATVTVLVRVTNPRDVFAWATREAAVPAGVLRLSAATQADDLLRDTIRARRFQASVFGTICTASLVIVGIGILGLTAMTSARRRREIGIRLALGATRRRVVVQLCREQFGATAVGLLAGLVAGFGATIVVARSYVYGTPPWSVEVWLAAVATIVLTASIGMIIPARRASRVDPVVVLRCD